MIRRFFSTLSSVILGCAASPGSISVIKPLYSSVTVCLVMLLSFGLIAPLAHAQLFADVSLEISPKYPKVGDTVTATLVSSEVNLDFQNISWYINGKQGLSGVAQTSQIFSIDPDIKTYTIRAVIGNSVSPMVRELTITPGELILLWEAVDSYVPYWYRGKALMPAEGVVRITAIPVGADSPSSLFYVWKQGSNSLGAQSGYGKNTIVLRNNILLDSLDVSVTVSSASGSYQSDGSLSIPRSVPEVRLWSPRIGYAPTYEQSGMLSLYGADATVEAIPYNMSSRGGGRGLSFGWMLNQIPYVHSDNESDSSIFIARSPAIVDVDLDIQSINGVLDTLSVQKKLKFE